MGSIHANHVDFVKMHGAGNDYVYIDATRDFPSNPSDLAVRISDRHFGVGGDGLVFILPSDVADFRMRMFNADGSEAQMCGNASRCIGKFLYDRGMTSKTVVSLETLAGIKILHLHVGEDNLVESVTVDMGAPEVRADKIPCIPSATRPEGYSTIEMNFEDECFEAVAVSMGNPHAVIFIDNPISDRHILHVGRSFENHPAWPEKTNVEFIHVINRSEIEMRVWERGSGETLACGTGACASVAAGIMTGLLDDEVTVNLLGGRLRILFDRATGHIFMTGPAATVAEGKFFYSENS